MIVNMVILELRLPDMPAHSKETVEIVEQIRDLASKNMNEKRISEIVGLARGTIKRIAAKHSIKLVERVRPDSIGKESEFIKLLKSGHTITKSASLAGIGAQRADDYVKKHDLTSLVRTRGQAALDKVLSLEEAQDRVPKGQGTVVGFKNGKYVIVTGDEFEYSKTSAKLGQGDPRDKSGTRLTLAQIKDLLDEWGYTYVSGFTTSRVSFKVEHKSCGYIRETRLRLIPIDGCSRCSNSGTSQAETDLAMWVESLGLKTEKYKIPKSSRTKPKEVDIFVPSKGIGIEYCGLYWHSETFKDKLYHKNKMDLVETNGYRLITIFEDEWIKREAQVKNFIKSALKISDISVYARKCEVVELDKGVGTEFVKQYHIQGAARLPIKYLGLMFENQLLGVMSLGRHHRKNNNDEVLVLDRLCFKDGVSVAGGSSKLLSHAIRWAKSNGFLKLISWSDNRWSQGAVYKACGFTLEEELAPDYSYVHKQLRIPKQSCKKENLKKLGAVGQTESEMAKSLGYSRIWDCGKKRWVLFLLPSRAIILNR